MKQETRGEESNKTGGVWLPLLVVNKNAPLQIGCTCKLKRAGGVLFYGKALQTKREGWQDVKGTVAAVAGSGL